MVKGVLKEILIILLLVIAIGLVLGIMFYELMPSSKIVPTAIPEYQLSKELQRELDESVYIEETQNIVRTYSVTRTDLYTYEQSRDYVKGKPNPFAKDTSTNNNTTNSTGNNTTNNNTSSGNTNTGSNEGGGGPSVENNNTGRFLNTIK